MVEILLMKRFEGKSERYFRENLERPSSGAEKRQRTRK